MSEKDSVKFEEAHTRGEDNSSPTAQYKINFYGADFTLEVLNNKLNSEEIIIPKFQRKFVWPLKRASKLIESFLLGLPVPQIFLYREEKTQDLLVVDGHQRLRSIQCFFSGTFDDGRPFRLRGVKASWEGKDFEHLKGTEQRYLKNSVLRATIFEQTDPKDRTSMFEIFNRLNTGGMPLSSQEIRNCLSGGKLSELLHNLNLNPKWRILLNTPLPDRRMRDVEMILRFFALTESWESYTKTMRDFLTNYMADNRYIDDEKTQRFIALFNEIIDKLSAEIGPPAFRLQKVVNVSVFDSVMVSLAEVGPTNVTDLPRKFRELLQDETYRDYVSSSTTDTDRVKGRIKIAIGKFS